ncbi:hypothetical protein Bca52824_094860 [Brassica carinata]|uniref:Pseudouridine synthase I TruA alpha/beta domain-containing protein n=1 Tax=Brassica carinata TaxID=52824 RepID=A0A8X7TKB3_BRACI|nr:hypothetical protein Bca52824_094860 [Brassica carinata]
MSTTITAGDVTDFSGGGEERRKVAIILAFCGVGYLGMQRNPGAKTIEGELEEALFRAGSVTETDRGKPKQYDFTRCARTDKGVSAVGQSSPGFGYRRVPEKFSSKKFCDRRRYVYLLPVFALDPFTHRDREAYVKCFECSERGRKNKITGVVGKLKGDSFDAKSLDVRSDITSNSLSALRTDVKSKFCYGEEEKERFNRILSYYVGSYNFHNFTTRIKADDPAANRSIISFTANTVISLDGIEFIKCEVLGQSFMLHQIRKMMGLAVAIMRNCAPESLIETAFSKDVNITVPMAPEVGLYLDECFFTSYNNTKYEDSHEEVSMEAYKEEAEAFKLKHIYSHIGSAERRYGSVALWLHSLNYRNYPDLNYGRNGHNTEPVLVYKTVGEAQETTEPVQVLVSEQNDENYQVKTSEATMTLV